MHCKQSRTPLYFFLATSLLVFAGGGAMPNQ